ncbi:3-methyladenine DNA glycosylase AlkC [Kibdelosporangium banguiense]|uniref:3-methyladenine DNA glycosylase AlkC n=1 Tax=Kibdelosporangium banguiense TaxID=1365924 RepID=A0ABS4TN78_9PSEU|nr:DNA alkylation repair protein [Kibdelosporangium banguiense]MBP2325861.1 3-methyladenine DNA glycosylase AlkC [Kibdelosporangium banguiense]
MPFADEMLSTEIPAALAKCLAGPGRRFAKVKALDLAGLSLRERVDLVREALLAEVTGYPELDQLIREGLAKPEFTGWMIWPVTEAVSVSAVADGSAKAFRSAMALLAELTKRLTAEFGIRALLEADLENALPIVLKWTKNPDEHVRRLASEGTRPFLPWAKRVQAIVARPESTVAILDALHQDESAYVRRSVANHLNDISKADPDLAVRIATRWSADPATRQLVRHGLRTLVKKGHPGALALLGFAPPAGIRLAGPRLGVDVVRIGGELSFSLTVHNEGAGPANLVIDYVMHHRKANGSQTPKVFKLVTRELAAGQQVTIDRNHSFRLITTRVYHPGTHALEIQINGESFGRAEFELT